MEQGAEMNRTVHILHLGRGGKDRMKNEEQESKHIIVETVSESGELREDLTQ